MRSRALGGLVAAVALSVSGCAGSPLTGGSGLGEAVTAAFPVAVVDCAGKPTSFEEPAQRIVTSNGAALEILLRLGVDDQVIGTGFPPGAGYLPDDLAARGAKVPVLGQGTISKEKLLGSGADLYVDAFGAMGSMGGPPSDQEMTAARIKHLYLLSTACASGKGGPQTDLANVEQDVKRLGAVTGKLSRADELVATMEATTDRVRAALKDLPSERRPGYFFFDYDAGTKQPMAVCGRQVANAVITLAGARNVFEDCDADFRPVGWEDVVAKDPDWIQLGVRSRGNAADTEKAFDEAEQFLRSSPATREMKAVREGHFLRIGSEVTTIAGTRNADTVQRIARTVHPDLVKDGE